MRRTILSVVLLLLFASANATYAQRLDVIFETDMGNDVDDALAMDMLYKYHRMKTIRLMAVMVNKKGQYPPRFISVLNDWYGCKEIPIGVCTQTNGAETQEKNYTEAVCMQKNRKGHFLYRQAQEGDENPYFDAVMLYRQLLAKAKESSVTIISVGFSSNLAALLASKADGFSALNGQELVAQKVDRLVVMAGHMENPEFTEFNVVNDIAACQKVFDEWPTPIYTSPYELGEKILFPGERVCEQLDRDKNHPVFNAYKSYLPGMEDRPTWDLTAVLYAVAPQQMFHISPAGRIRVTDRGCTHYSQDATGNHYYISADEKQREQIKAYFVQMIFKKP